MHNEIHQRVVINKVMNVSCSRYSIMGQNNHNFSIMEREVKKNLGVVVGSLMEVSTQYAILVKKANFVRNY